MRNVLTIASTSHATASRPPRALMRRCAPISTPRLEESMNVVAVRSTTTCSAAGGDRRHHALLELGAGEEVHLARDRHDVRRGVHAPILDRRTRWPCPAGSVPARAPVLIRAVVGEPDAQVLALAVGLDLEPVRQLLDHVPDARHGGVDDAARGRRRGAAGRRGGRSSARRTPGRRPPSRARRGRAPGRRRGRPRARRRPAGPAAGRPGRRASRPRAAARVRPAARRRSTRGSALPVTSLSAGVHGSRRKDITSLLPRRARARLDREGVGDRGDERQSEPRPGRVGARAHAASRVGDDDLQRPRRRGSRSRRSARSARRRRAARRSCTPP